MLLARRLVFMSPMFGPLYDGQALISGAKLSDTSTVPLIF